jgi:hypothetical protein
MILYKLLLNLWLHLIHISLKHKYSVAHSVRTLLCRISEGLIVACRKGRVDVAETFFPHKLRVSNTLVSAGGIWSRSSTCMTSRVHVSSASMV